MKIAAAIAIGTLFFILVVLGVPASLWFLYRTIARAAERRALAHPPEVVGEPGRVTPALLACAVAMPLVTLFLAAGSRSAAAPLSLIGALMIVTAWFLHGLPGHSRNLKYGFYLLGSAILAAGLGSGGSGRLQVVVAGFGVAHVVAALLCVVLLRPDEPLVRGDASSRRALVAHRFVSWMQGPDVRSLLAMGGLSILQLGIPYVLIRWCTGARLGRHAVLYLRSFQYEGAGHVFGQIVTPAVHRTVAMTGLVHVEQPTAEMNRHVPLLWRSHFAAISDARWKIWVERHLSHALAVVLDLSVPTDAVAWEVAHARATVPAERLLVMRRSETASNVDLPTVVYDLDTPGGVEHAREGVSAWLSSALASADPALAGLRPLVSPPRRQFPMLALLILTVLFFGGVLTALAAHGVGKYLNGARAKGVRLDLRAIHRGTQEWMIEQRRGCPTVDDLAREKYISSNQRRDRWGTEIRVECGVDSVVVRSAGPDTRFDTKDDLVIER